MKILRGGGANKCNIGYIRDSTWRRLAAFIVPFTDIQQQKKSVFWGTSLSLFFNFFFFGGGGGGAKEQVPPHPLIPREGFIS